MHAEHNTQKNIESLRRARAYWRNYTHAAERNDDSKAIRRAMREQHRITRLIKSTEHGPPR